MYPSDLSGVSLIRVVIIVLASFPSLIWAYTKNFNMSVILKPGEKYCDLKCSDGSPHTLCNADLNKIEQACGRNFYQFKENEYELKEDFLKGHNGIRNRIADRMRAADMRRLDWDDELAKMASVWIRKCTPFQVDPCTNNAGNGTSEGQDNKTYLNQNSAFVKSKFFPPNFIASVLRDWYLEKNPMQPPSITIESEKKFGSFGKAQNNFTQLAWASTFRIGCAVARYEEAYQVVCNYYPYKDKNYAYQRGTPASYCPNSAPLTDILFHNLCCAAGIGVHVNIDPFGQTGSNPHPCPSAMNDFFSIERKHDRIC